MPFYLLYLQEHSSQCYTYKNTLLKEISSKGARKAFQVKTKKKTNHGDI